MAREAASERWEPGATVAAPLDLYRIEVPAEWVDYNNHMTEAAYLTAAGWAADAMFRYIGDDEVYREAGHSFYTVETHIHYLREASQGELLRVQTQLLAIDPKRVHLVHLVLLGEPAQSPPDASGATSSAARDGAASPSSLLCTVEQMLLHVDTRAGRSAPTLPPVAAALDAIMAAHANLAVPAQVGTVMALAHRNPTDSAKAVAQ